MSRNGERCKKFQKISAYIIAICLLLLIWSVGWLIWLEDGAEMPATLSFVLLLSLIGAVLDMAAILILQVILDIREKKIREESMKFLKRFLTFFGILFIIDSIDDVFLDQKGFQASTVKGAVGFAVVLAFVEYITSFWMRKIETEN